ncbi:hypothetical protein ABG79_02395 [Caloramator mitchellensis]|uniref:Uncharacterized protein n=1 Tax=Caloramator mitchellensis TaxID=908809 RepID=A0A0R3JQW4_CALMK|nr:hypothetical protein ABG79_02395 [Caloramator mitchellensis]
MKRIISIILTFFQALSVIAALTLQYLANKKMGVARFLIFYKSEFSKSLFSPIYLKLYVIIAIIIFIILILLTITKLKNKALMLLILNSTSLILLTNKPFLNLKAGYFILISLALAEIIEIIKLGINFPKN